MFPEEHTACRNYSAYIFLTYNSSSRGFLEFRRELFFAILLCNSLNVWPRVSGAFFLSIFLSLPPARRRLFARETIHVVYLHTISDWGEKFRGFFAREFRKYGTSKKDKKKTRRNTRA